MLSFQARMARWAGCLLLASLAMAVQPSWMRDVNAAREAIHKGDLALAESSLDRALAAARQTGDMNGRLPAEYEALGEAYRRKKLTRDAIRSIKLSAAAWEETIGPDQPKVAATLHRLATLYESENEFAEAERLRVRGIGILERLYGAAHPSVAAGWGRLAAMYARQSRLDDANRAYRTALRNFSSPAHSPALEDYIGFLRKASRHSEAVELEAALRQLDRPVFLGQGGVTPPRLLTKQEPEYPEEARQLAIEGVVVLSMIIDENGLPSSIEVVTPLGFGLDEKAVEAVSAWRFRPAEKDGQPVAVYSSVELNFRLL